MKHKIKIILLLQICLAASNIHAQSSMHLSLQEAIDLSLKNSKSLKQQTARIEEAVAGITEAKERRLPSAAVSASYVRLAKPNIRLQTVKDSSGGGNTAPSVNQALYGILNFSVPLYAGNRIKYGIEAAKYLEQAAILDAESEKPAVIINTVRAYLNIYKAKAAVSLVKESLSRSQQRVKDFINLEKNGLLARNELLKAQLQLSNTELDVLNAENNYQFANMALDLMLGLDETTLIIVDTVSVRKENELQSLPELEQIALQHRFELQSINSRKKAANTEIKSIHAEKLPSIALTGGYIAAYVPNFLTVTNALNAGIGVQYDISNFWRKGKLQQAKAREKQLVAGSEQMEEDIRLQVIRNYQDYTLSQKKTEVYIRSVEQAEENYRISKNKYDNALLTTTELLDADVAQLQAKLNLTASQADAALAYYTLLQTAGLINEKSKF